MDSIDTKEITIYGNQGAKTFRENQMIDLCGCWLDIVSVGVVDGKKQIVLEVSTIDEEHCKVEWLKNHPENR